MIAEAERTDEKKQPDVSDEARGHASGRARGRDSGDYSSHAPVNASGMEDGSATTSKIAARPACDFDASTFIKTVTQRPGVYQMLNDAGDTIYVGKAGNLKKRVSSYFQKDPGSAKTRIMVAQIASVELTVTNNEIEALLLENNLIKEKRPRYNILLRDDKSYPFLFVSTTEDFPRISYRRGGRKQKGK